MDPIYSEIYLDLQHKTIESVNLKQYDYNSRFIIIRITNNGNPYTLTSDIQSEIKIHKSDGTYIANFATLDIANNCISIEVTEQMTAIYGVFNADISLIKNGGVISTMPFNINVEKSPVQNSDVVSSSECGVLEKMIIDVQDAESERQENEIKRENAEIDRVVAENQRELATSTALSDINKTISETNEKIDSINALETSIIESENSRVVAESERESDCAIAISNAEKVTANLEEAINKCENAANEYALSAAKSATLAESYTKGGTGTRDNEDVDNAKYYKEQAEQISKGLSGALLPMGTITFSQLATISKQAGYMYNISDSFTTDSTFKEGAGYDYAAGTNVYYTADGYWDCIAGTNVIGVKGSSEVSYRQGNVNITKEDIGLGNVPNVATNDQQPTYSMTSENENLTSGEKMSVAFGKIAKAINSFISHLSNKSNPHGVTKSDVGLGNVDNTSDADKPISTATQSAIDLINSNLSNKNGYIAYASNDSLENIIENNISNMKQFIEYTFHVDNIIGTPFPSNNNVIVKVIITNDNKNSYNVEVADTTTSKKYYITKTNGTFGPWTTSIVDLDSNLTPNAFKNGKLITQTGVDLLDGSLPFNETRMIALTSAINSPIVSTGMALHKMEFTDFPYFTNIVTLFILDSSETWYNYYHSATKQWVGWVKS